MSGSRRPIGNRLAPARFLMFGVLLLAGWVGLMEHGGLAWDRALVLAFDGAALVFLASLLPLARAHTAPQMRRHSAENDANRRLVLLLSGAVALSILAAIHGELGAARGGDVMATALLIGTLAMGWTFVNVVFALHYAHAYYQRGHDGNDMGGFDFKGTREPDYWDFIYFAFTAGMSFAASDVDVTRGVLRRVVLVQCLLSFVFNIGVLAFSINVLAGGSS